MTSLVLHAHELRAKELWHSFFVKTRTMRDVAAAGPEGIIEYPLNKVCTNMEFHNGLFIFLSLIVLNTPQRCLMVIRDPACDVRLNGGV